MTAKDAMTTAELVEKARDPDASLQEQHAAFARLVQQSQHTVFAMALARLRDVEDAKDAAQNAFATAWHSLSQLRDPSAFAPWLQSLVVSMCARQRRGRAIDAEANESLGIIEGATHEIDYSSLIASALARLKKGERHVTVLYYFLGYTAPQIAQLLGLKTSTVDKRLHSARLRIRRSLPPSVRGDFVRLTPSMTFVDRVRRGLLDEYVGEYRFDSRPDRIVSITREGDALVSDSAGQRHLLVPGREQSLVTIHYDGEGRFGRNNRGDVTHFVYYEFGKRLGVARKIGLA
jgi:RNA polymerase sigma-70 factor (ECF subfamily)